jgi:hypothetical protein
MRSNKINFAMGIIFCRLVSIALADPTDGWTPDSPHIEIQSAYDLPHNDRYAFDAKTDTYHLWVFATDKPMAKHNTTEPRTELSFDKYTSGQHQFEADVLVVTNTSRVTIMQVFGGPGRENGTKHASALQLRVYNGELKRYENETLLTNIYDKWFHLNVTHDVATHEIQIFINNKLSLTTKDFGGPDLFHMKCGVYAQKNASSKMEIYYRNIKIYHK